MKNIISKTEELYPIICGFIEDEGITDNPYGLLEGKTGAGLFLYQYALQHPEKKKECYLKINRLMDKAFDYISETPDIRTSYCEGLAGILWLVQFFRNQKVLRMNKEDIPMDIVYQLSEYSVFETTQQQNCDFLHGGFGFWAFLLESADLSQKEKFIGMQLQALDKIKIKTSAGCNWKIDLEIYRAGDKEKEELDVHTTTHLGLAHGISSILILLAKTKIQGYFEKETEERIHEGLSHLRSLKNNVADSGYVYPSVVINEVAQSDGRLAWCNGDLGVAQAYWMGWKATGVKSYKEEALQIMNAALQLEKENTGAVDAGLCHGTAGIAQLFRRFYWETNEKQFEMAADKWINFTLEMAAYPDGIAGYKTYSPEIYGGPRKEFGFLSGASGIGTVLLSALTTTPTTWDRVLQIC